LNNCQEILLLEYSMYRLLSKEARTPKHRIPKVVVFIPLPVEFGEAPMNINTIGFKGGCNPIVIDYSIKDGNIVVPIEGLMKNESIFK